MGADIDYSLNINAIEQSKTNIINDPKYILSLNDELVSLNIKDILDIPAIQSMMDDFYSLTHIGMALLNLNGEVLVATGWQDICTKFHRVHPETLKNCIESDCLLTATVATGSVKAYKCKNNLWDIVTPLEIENQHVGNIFFGQFFYDDESLDQDLFQKQAHRYGFDEKEYLDALHQVPRLSHKTVDTAMSFYTKLATIVSSQSYNAIKLSHALSKMNSLLLQHRESEELLRAYMKRSPIYTYIKEVTPTINRIIQASENFQQMLGSQGVNIIGKTIEELFPPEFAAKITADDWLVVTKGEVLKIDEDFNGRNYTSIKFPITQSDKTLVAGYTIDITESKQIEDALRESETKYKSIFEGSSDAIFLADTETGILMDCNEAACRLIERSKKDIIGQSQKIIHPPDQYDSDDKFSKSFKNHLTAKVGTDTETQIITASGIIKDVIVKASPVFDSGKRKLTIGLFHDITERKKLEVERLQLEIQFQQQHKLESIGVLAGGIAHDFNNLLAGIFGYIDIACEEAKKGNNSNIIPNLTKALAVMDRAKSITGQLLTFSKGGSPTKTTMNISRLIKDVTTFTLSGSAVVPEFYIDDDLWLSEIDENQMAQAIDNIVRNAKEAIERGTVTIRVENISSRALLPKTLKPGKYLRISISNKGPIIPKQHFSKIFDPFFSTKENGHGLGLSIAYSIVKKHEGLLTVESEISTGTSFYIYLPAVIELKVSSKTIRSEQCRGKGNILIMDDELTILEITNDMLKRMGYTTTCVTNGEDTIRRYKEAIQLEHPFDAVIMDLTIKDGLGGVETIKELSKIDPKIAAIVCSGYAENDIIADPQAYGFKAAIIKPYRATEIHDLLQKLLNSR